MFCFSGKAVFPPDLCLKSFFGKKVDVSQREGNLRRQVLRSPCVPPDIWRPLQDGDEQRERSPYTTLLANASTTGMVQCKAKVGQESRGEGGDPCPCIPKRWEPFQKKTARVARAACPKGTLAMRLRAVLAALSQDEQCVALSPVEGQPASAPWRLAVVTVLQDTDAVRERIDWT